MKKEAGEEGKWVEGFARGGEVVYNLRKAERIIFEKWKIQEILLMVYLLNKYLLGVCYMAGTVLGSGEGADQVPALLEVPS